MKRLIILATGGTIAGFIEDSSKTTNYKAGSLDIERLLNSLNIDLAYIKSEQLANIDSCDIDNDLQLKLSNRVNEIFDNDEADCVVITHGTDTMEESAYFLSLSVKSNKNVVFVGSMRPFSAIGYDGIKNLQNAIYLALNAEDKGVMILMNDKILSPKYASKTHTLNLNAFSSLNFGDLGYVIDKEIIFYENISNNKLYFDLKNVSKFPKVDILYTYSNDGSAIAAKALFENQTKGIVIASSGCGSIHKYQKEVLKELLKQGLKVIVSSRVHEGKVVLSKEDEELGFISANYLNPQKARILLMFALLNTNDNNKIREYFKN